MRFIETCIETSGFMGIYQMRIKYKAVTVDDLAAYIAWFKYIDISRLFQIEADNMDINKAVFNISVSNESMQSKEKWYSNIAIDSS